MSETTGIFMEYEIAYRRDRLQRLASPRRVAHRQPATARFLRSRRTRHAA